MLINITLLKNPEAFLPDKDTSFCRSAGSPKSKNIINILASEKTVIISPYSFVAYFLAMIKKIKKKNNLSAKPERIKCLLSEKILISLLNLSLVK